MVVINDIATLDDIHPPNKQDVGNRLAMLALKKNYGKIDIVAESPAVDSFQLDGNKLVVTFENTGGGLTTRDKQAPTHFEIIGPGAGGFVPAKATIHGDTVALSADGITAPTAFRFAWDKFRRTESDWRNGPTSWGLSSRRGARLSQPQLTWSEL